MNPNDAPKVAVFKITLFIYLTVELTYRRWVFQYRACA
ncbi:hypothetical protein D1AOALGA4SA_8715 [Olavius algarvensis Delta 1 endosymbiont]|nr:hypothetical protein D1AOALGA4SA_8715 [Olavius algarvensis Delta 1 endosymbiont]